MKQENRNSPLPNYIKRNISISGVLTISLTLAVVISSIAAFSVVYSVLSQRGYAHLEQKADEFSSALQGILEIPLWDLDYRNVHKIGEAFIHNELFEHLCIIDNAGTVHYHFDRRTGGEVVKRSGNVLHEGKEIGSFEMALTTKLYEEQNRQVLLIGIGLLLLVILVLAVATGLLVRILSKKIFHQLDTVANAYASETYDPSIHEMTYVEFRPLINILGDLRDKIDTRMMEVRDAEKKYRGIFENAVEGIFQLTEHGEFISANPALARMLEYDSADDLIRSVSDVRKQLFVDPAQWDDYFNRVSRDYRIIGFQTRFYTRSQNILWISVNARFVYDDSGERWFVEGMAQDITQQKKSEEDRERLEQQLLQSQKMESVGRLAGGVAHDFNNMLAIILGYTELILQNLPSDNPHHDKLMEILKAAERSADLTRQLLAFARKQAVSPRVLNLNDTVAGMLKMLQRLLGEDITLVWMPSSDLSPVKIDPSQIDQMLVNLCINARDAIPENGIITIETSNATLDDTFFKTHVEMGPGDYVMLSVSDDGCGMDASVSDHIFEPFFTTKGSTEGTGLGLSTVYGIVKQNNGSITVYSEPGKGTTFRIYLPSHTGEPLSAAEPESGGVPGKGETVLLVEDEERLLILEEKVLVQMGYTVISSSDPFEAVRLARAHGHIDFLITDVVMPGMNGRDLADELTRMYPGLKCLFMSGYTADVIAHQGVLEKGIHFIQKPFSKNDLAARIREMLGTG